MLPSVPQAGRENPAMVGRVMLHWLGSDLHVPGVIKVSPGMVQVLVGSVGSGIVVKTGVNQVRFPFESRFGPSLNDPEALSGRQTPTSWSRPQSLNCGVHGSPRTAGQVAVVGGGCSGLQYKMDLQDNPANRDILVETSGIRVVVDPKSALYVTGSELDYRDTLQDGGFKVTNPNAATSCSCGESFSA